MAWLRGAGRGHCCVDRAVAGADPLGAADLLDLRPRR